MRVAMAGKVFTTQVGGNSRYVHNLVPGLREQGVDVQVLEGRGPSYLLREALVWPRTAAADVLHYPADNGPLVPSRVPTVGTIHGMASLHVAGVRSPAREALWRARMRRLAQVADRLITVSHSSASDLRHHLGDAAPPIDVVYQGVDHARFHPTAGDGERDAVTGLGVPEGRYVLYLGNIEPRKNVAALARAADEVHAATGARVVVAGAPAWDAEDSLRAMASSSTLVHLGRVGEDLLAPLIRQADVFCFPSLYEGFGLPVLEAMACGTAVLCSSNGSLPEVGGDAVTYLDDTSDRTVARQLVELLSDGTRLAAAATAGPRRAGTFSWDRCAREHARIYREAVR